MPGDQVLRELRRSAPGLPVVLSSGYPEREALARLADAGPLGFVQKPWSPEALLGAVRTALEGRSTD
jgi:two-component system C4-dicarboxylate transport response regulator DctD